MRKAVNRNGIAIFSFFSGSGFLDLGFESIGFDIVFVNEINQSFLNAYQFSRNRLCMKSPKYGYSNDSMTVFLNEKKEQLNGFINNERKEGKLIGFIGGPPCPDFSIAGKNRGMNGDNGKLTSIYFDLIKEMKPSFFLFENVKGLWKTKKHRQFYEEQKKKMMECGYQITDNLVNALEYGVPQDRERVFLFGIQNKILGNDCIDAFDWSMGKKYKLKDILEKKWPQTETFSVDSIRPCPDDIIEELTVEYWFEKNNVLSHPNSNDYFVPQKGIDRIKNIMEGDVSKKSYKRLHRWRFSPTVAYGNNEVHLHPYKIRRISVAEALALQSLPSDFILPPDMTLTDMFKTIGNGVPFCLSCGIASSVCSFLERVH